MELPSFQSKSGSWDDWTPPTAGQGTFANSARQPQKHYILVAWVVLRATEGNHAARGLPQTRIHRAIHLLSIHPLIYLGAVGLSIFDFSNKLLKKKKSLSSSIISEKKDLFKDKTSKDLR